MQHKALVIDSTRLFQNMIKEIMKSVGMDCSIYSSGKDALEAEHSEYTFIIVSRTLEDVSGDIFLKRFAVQHNLGNAFTIMLTSDHIEENELNDIASDYSKVLSKKDISSLAQIVRNAINSQALKLDANILLIEDSQSIADLVLSLFQENNSNIQHVTQISDMKSVFDNQEFDLVITDYYLHGDETGDDVINYVREFNCVDRSKTPILVISGESNQQKRTAFLKNGANDFILKPYDNDELLVRSSNLISNNRVLKKSKQQQQQLMKLALTDHLTGLYNRHILNDIGPKYINNAQRQNIPLSLFVIDLDHFKKVNDTHGHAKGDSVLQAVAAVLQGSCRTEDIVVRFGGEEFIMMLSNCDIEEACKKAEKLRYDIENCNPSDLKITTSIGATQLGDKDDFDSFFNRADKAVYKAKEGGRNKVIIEPLDAVS